MVPRQELCTFTIQELCAFTTPEVPQSVSRVGVNRHRQYREKGAGDRIPYHRDKILMCVSYDIAIAT